MESLGEQGVQHVNQPLWALSLREWFVSSISIRRISEQHSKQLHPVASIIQKKLGIVAGVTCVRGFNTLTFATAQ